MMGQQKTVTVAGSALRRTLLGLAVAALMAAIIAYAALPVRAQEGPPSQAPSCGNFDNAAEHIKLNPASGTFGKQLDRIGGIGPCFGPHQGGAKQL
jgi:hypothetical protein